MTASPDVYSMERELDVVAKLDGEEKKQRLVSLREKAATFERHAATDWDVPFDQIRRCRKIHDYADGWLSRLDKNKKEKSNVR